MLDERQQRYLDWLCDPDRGGSKTDQANAFGLAPSTVYRWERLPAFRKAWADRVQELGGDPDRVKRVYDTLFEKAVGGDTKSAELWLRAVGKLNNAAQVEVNTKGARDLTNAELEAIIAEQATAERNRRSLRAVGADA